MAFSTLHTYPKASNLEDRLKEQHYLLVKLVQVMHKVLQLQQALNGCTLILTKHIQEVQKLSELTLKTMFLSLHELDQLLSS